MKTLKDVTTKITDGSHNPPKKAESGIPMYSAQNVFNNLLDTSKYRFITAKDFEKERQRAPVDADDVLLTIVGTIGRCYVVKDDDGEFALQRSVALLKPNKDLIDPRFLSYYLQSGTAQQYLNKHSRGVAQKGVYLRLVREMPIPLPSLAKQAQVVEKIEELFSELDAGSGYIEKAFGSVSTNMETMISSLKKSVLKKYYSRLENEEESND